MFRTMLATRIKLDKSGTIDNVMRLFNTNGHCYDGLNELVMAFVPGKKIAEFSLHCGGSQVTLSRWNLHVHLDTVNK